MSLTIVHHLSAEGLTRELTASELGQLCDIEDTAEREKRRLAKLAEEQEYLQNQAKALIIDQLRKQKATACGGSLVKLSLNPVKYKPHVTDWSKVYDYIYDNKAFSLLERRPSVSAVTERWDDGQVIPGMEQFPVYTLSKSRVK